MLNLTFIERYKNGKALIKVILVLTILFALPLSIFLLQRRTQQDSLAALGNATLAIMPASVTIPGGQSGSLNVFLNPNNEDVSSVELVINYDPAKINVTNVQPGDFWTYVDEFGDTVPPAVIKKSISNGQIHYAVGFPLGSNYSSKLAKNAAVISYTTLATGTTTLNFIKSGQPQTLVANLAAANVLNTTTNGTIEVTSTGGGNPTVTPTPTASQNTPTVTSSPINTATPNPTIAISNTPRTATKTPMPTATKIVLPTNTPLPTFTPLPTGNAGSTKVSLTLLLHGIGTGGDNVNPTGTGNMNPLHPSRTLSLDLYNSKNQLVTTKQGLVNYTSGEFKGILDLGGVPSGSYLIKIKSPQYLNTYIPGIFELTEGQTKSLTKTSLITGDMDLDNTLSILDYSMLIDCFAEIGTPKNCDDPNKKNVTDLTDDGSVNQYDYNLFLRELSVQPGK